MVNNAAGVALTLARFPNRAKFLNRAKDKASR
jgi:hypothetical protein